MRFRRATDPYVAAYAENVAYGRAAVRSTYSLFTRHPRRVRAADARHDTRDARQVNKHAQPSRAGGDGDARDARH